MSPSDDGIGYANIRSVRGMSKLGHPTRSGWLQKNALKFTPITLTSKTEYGNTVAAFL